MKKYGIINFNSASFTQKMADFKDLESIFLGVTVDDEDCTYDDSETLFAKVKKSKKIPKTSQPVSGDILETYKKMLEKYEQIFILTPAKKLSGTHQNAVMTRDMLEDELEKNRLHIIETRSFAISEAIICDRAIDLIEADADLEEIISELNQLAKKITTYIIPGTFDYLKLSGRVNLSQLVIGKLMLLKLFIKQKDGLAEVIKKSRGLKKIVQEAVLEKNKYKNIEEIYYTEIGGIDKERELLHKELGEGKTTISSSVVLGAHFGPGTLGFAIISGD